MSVSESTTVNPIVITVFVPGIQVRRLPVWPSTHLATLAATISKRPITLIWRGEVLNSTQTFADYGVGDQDTILAVPVVENAEQTRPRWLRLSEDQEHCERLTNMCRAVGGRREYTRLRDVALLKTECCPRQFRKLARVRSVGLSVPDPTPREQVTVIPEPPSEISTSPLPQTW
jgi:hypothetical protein